MDSSSQSELGFYRKSHIWVRTLVAVCPNIVLTFHSSVNLGGWFVLEPFITPTLFQKYPGAVDEWTLSTLMAADTSPGGGLGQIEDHYKTFIVRTNKGSTLTEMFKRGVL